MWLLDVIVNFFPALTDMIRQDTQVPDAFLQIFSIASTPLTFPWVGTVQLVFQGIALALCIVVIIIKGLTSGIMLPGTDGERSVIAYLWRSTWPIVLIMATPALVSLTVMFSISLVNAFTTNISANIVEGFFNATIWVAGTGSFSLAVGAVLFLVAIYYTISILLQCIKRQIQLVVLSCISPLVSVFTISDNNIGNYFMIFQEMIGIGVTTALQILVLYSAFTIPVNSTVSQDFGILMPFVMVGVLAAIKQLPKWIERFTLAVGVSGSGNRVVSVAAGAAARGAVMKAVA